MTKCMSYQGGEADLSFSLRNQGAYGMSICEVQILMQHRSRFYVFYMNINYLILATKSDTYLRTVSATLTHR